MRRRCSCMPKTQNLPGAPAGGGPARLTRSSATSTPPSGAPSRSAGTSTSACQRTATGPRPTCRSGQAIREQHRALSFNNYLRFMDLIFCGTGSSNRPSSSRIASAEGDSVPQGAAAEATAALHRHRRLPRGQGGDRGLRDRELRRLGAATRGRSTTRATGDFCARRDLPFPSNGLDAGVRRGLPGAVRGRRARQANAAVPGHDPAQSSPTSPSSWSASTSTPDPGERVLRHPAGEADQPLPARADLVVLARGRHARPDDERRSRGASRTSAAPAAPDPLANLEIDPLRPLNNLLWGYMQDEQHRLTRRRGATTSTTTTTGCASKAGGAGSAARPTRARSSSRPSTTCCGCAPCSTSRTTTRRSRPTRSPCSTR